MGFLSGSIEGLMGGATAVGGADGPAAVFTAQKASEGSIGDAVVLGLEGMAGIFIVMVVIALVVWALPKLSSAFDKKAGRRGDGPDKTEDDR